MVGVDVVLSPIANHRWLLRYLWAGDGEGMLWIMVLVTEHSLLARWQMAFAECWLQTNCVHSFPLLCWETMINFS